LGTRIHAVVDARGLPVHIVLTPGQASDKTTLPVLIERLRLVHDVIADRGFFARAIIELIEAGGAIAQIPSQSNVKVRRVVDLDIASATSSTALIRCRWETLVRAPVGTNVLPSRPSRRTLN
jgi:transposase